MTTATAAADAETTATQSDPSKANLSLDTLALRYGTDKSSAWHGYARSYERCLAPLREAGARGIVEIGVCRKWDGNRHICPSLAMWSDWFGPQASVAGLDKLDFSYAEGAILTMVCDQSSVDALVCAEYAIGKVHGRPGEGGRGVDLIVDDGSHEAAHQQLTMKVLWQALRVGGAYVIEDLNYNPEGADKAKRERTRECVEDWQAGKKPNWLVDLRREMKQVGKIEWVDSAKAGAKSSVVFWKDRC